MVPEQKSPSALEHARMALERGDIPGLSAQQWRLVSGGSEFAQRVLEREFTWLSAGNGLLFQRPLRSSELAASLAEQLAEVASESALQQRLRQFRNRHMARIVWRDLAGLAELDETLLELSDLADACITQALQKLHGWACARDGVPRDAQGRAQQLVVLGMGKLGARELNLSSDVDLVFCFPEHGQTDAPRPVSNEAYFSRLGQQLIGALSNHTEHGFVFRVDMRLRPFGDSGPLVVSFGAMEQYLIGQARDWERYAMVKARALTGEPSSREALQQLIKAFVYRRYIDFGVIEAIRQMKSLLTRELHEQRNQDDIKLGWGGIREIEFIGQAFQLVRGGQDAELQIRPIQRVLELLGKKQLLPQFAVSELLKAYVYLRRCENRLQAWQDRQVHRLPSEEAARLRLALSMGEPDWATFTQTLAAHRQRVHEQFECVFEAPQVAAAAPLSPWDAVWIQAPEEAEAVEELLAALGQAGFADPRDILRQLQQLQKAPALRAVSAKTRQRFDRLMSLTLGAVAASDRPDATLTRLLDLFQAILRRTAYIDLLVENPMALSQLVRLLGESRWMGSQLARQPILLDELLDPRRLYQPMRRVELREELSALLASAEQGDQEQELQRLRQFAHSNRLRVAAADLSGALRLPEVSECLTDIAEVSLQQVQQSAWRDLVARHGEPQLAPGYRQGFAVIGYGKLGSFELGYGSDLDLVFLHADAGGQELTSGPRALANEVFFARLGQRMIHMLTTRLPSGYLYQVDMRLRPNGASGLLASSLKAFSRYQLRQAWVWEHQALVRARAVGGDPLVMDEFARLRRAVLCRPRDPQPLREAVCNMRHKMAAQLDRSSADKFDLKHGVGGLIDIEFLVQYAVLRWAAVHPGLVEYTDNARLLQRLHEYRLFQGDDAAKLEHVYQRYRQAAHLCALQEQPLQLEPTVWNAERALVRAVWGRLLT